MTEFIQLYCSLNSELKEKTAIVKEKLSTLQYLGNISE